MDDALKSLLADGRCAPAPRLAFTLAVMARIERQFRRALSAYRRAWRGRRPWCWRWRAGSWRSEDLATALAAPGASNLMIAALLLAGPILVCAATGSAQRD